VRITLNVAARIDFQTAALWIKPSRCNSLPRLGIQKRKVRRAVPFVGETGAWKTSQSSRAKAVCTKISPEARSS
jgi:hypothetical protein